MKKKKSPMRKLLAAVLMLAISTASLIGSTYAWFTMNAAVSATGMQIEAKNEAGTLLIGAATWSGNVKTSPDVDAVQAAAKTSVNLGEQTYNYIANVNAPSAFAVKPSHFNSLSSGASASDPLGQESDWFFKTADAPDYYYASSGATTVPSFDGFVITYDLFITVAKGSPDMTNLRCTATIVPNASGFGGDNTIEPVRVLIASPDASEEFYITHREGNGTDSGTHQVTENFGDGTVLASTIDDDHVVPIKVYIYVDGEDSKVFTENSFNLKKAAITLNFTAEQAS